MGMKSISFSKSQERMLVIGCCKVLGKLDMTFEEVNLISGEEQIKGTQSTSKEHLNIDEF